MPPMEKRLKTADEEIGIWVIRAGVLGNAEEYFTKKERIVLEEQGMGDLRKIKPDRASFYQRYKSLHPDETRTAIAGVGGKFFRFIHEIKRGDIILYPSRSAKKIYVGHVTGDYEFVGRDLSFPHQRDVSWRDIIPKPSFSKAAQYELNAARTLFKFKKHVGELMELIGNVND